MFSLFFHGRNVPWDTGLSLQFYLYFYNDVIQQSSQLVVFCQIWTICFVIRPDSWCVTWQYFKNCIEIRQEYLLSVISCWQELECSRCSASAGMIILPVHWTYWRPLRHAQTWASYNAVYQFCTLSFLPCRFSAGHGRGTEVPYCDESGRQARPVGNVFLYSVVAVSRGCMLSSMLLRGFISFTCTLWWSCWVAESCSIVSAARSISPRPKQVLSQGSWCRQLTSFIPRVSCIATLNQRFVCRM